MIYKNMVVISFLFFNSCCLVRWLFRPRRAAGEPDRGIGSLSDEALERLTRAEKFIRAPVGRREHYGGVKELIGRDPRLKLKIVENAAPERLEPGFFYHGPIGKNENPASKIDDFAARIKAGVGGQASVAFFKFCYIDIMASRNIDETLLTLPEGYG